MCASPNEVICHGIPDQRLLMDGDILNLDISLFFGGYHADLNETYYIGERAEKDPDSVRVVETARECLNVAIQAVKPGVPFKEFGNLIEKRAKESGCSTVRAYCGHGINRLFHCPPDILHYARNKAVGIVKPGMTFTIEPMIALGSYHDITWPDGWTSTTADGKRTAQFGMFCPWRPYNLCRMKLTRISIEHTLLVTEDGVEVLTARLPDSPGGPVKLEHEA